MSAATPTEHLEQVALLAWCRMKTAAYPDLAYLVAVPNGGDRHPVVAAKLKAEGVRRGYPDLLLDVARGGWHGLRIELKRRKGGRLSEHQEDWHRRLWSQGYKVVVCRGWEEAAAELVAYLALPLTVNTSVA